MATKAEEKKPEVEKKGEDEEDSDDDMPELENAEPNAAAGAAAGQADASGKQSRGEKKSRKLMSKLGMKPVTGIHRVTVKKAKNILFVISKPEVFKSPGSDTYIVFGEAKVEDLGQTLGKSAFDQLQKEPSGGADDMPALTPADAGAAKPAAAAAKPAAATTAADEGPVDETGVDPKDIELVMAQTNASRARAVKALKKKNNDIVEAIIELTVS